MRHKSIDICNLEHAVIVRLNHAKPIYLDNMERSIINNTRIFTFNITDEDNAMNYSYC